MWMVITMLTMVSNGIFSLDIVSNGIFSLDTSILHGALVGSGPLLFVTMVIS
jgi:hypothetical protein